MIVASSAQSLVRVSPIAGEMALRISIPDLPDSTFTLVIPKAIGSREGLWLNAFETAGRLQWQQDAEGTFYTQWSPGGRLEFSCRVKPQPYRLETDVTITNRTQYTWHDVYCFTGISMREVPGFADAALDRTWVSRSGEPESVSRLAAGSPPRWASFDAAVTLSPGDRFFCLGEAAHQPRIDAPWIARTSVDGQWVLGLSAPRALMVFQNTEFGSIHVAPWARELPPDGTLTLNNRLDFCHRDLAGYLKQLPTHTSEPETAGHAPSNRRKQE